MATHFGRAWVGTAIEDACPCAKAACGLVVKISAECDQHPIELSKTIRQAHAARDCPSMPDAVGGAVQKAYDDFCAELDTIAGCWDLTSDVFSRIIAGGIGEQPGYDEWMQETWEPLTGEAT